MEKLQVEKQRSKKYKRDKRRRRSIKQRLGNQKGVLLDELQKVRADRDTLMTTATKLKK